MTPDPDHLLRCTAAELDLLDRVARNHLTAFLLIEEANSDADATRDSRTEALTKALAHLQQATDDLGYAYAAARGHIYDLPTRRDQR